MSRKIFRYLLQYLKFFKDSITLLHVILILVKAVFGLFIISLFHGSGACASRVSVISVDRQWTPWMIILGCRKCNILIGIWKPRKNTKILAAFCTSQNKDEPIVCEMDKQRIRYRRRHRKNVVFQLHPHHYITSGIWQVTKLRRSAGLLVIVFCHHDCFGNHHALMWHSPRRFHVMGFNVLKRLFVFEYNGK